jgi:cytochrome c oxidase subunit 4
MSHAPIVPIRTYLAIFSALLILTAGTVVVAYFDLGMLNTPVALGVATLKATLVVLFFMHLKYDKIFHTVVFMSAILAAILFVGFTLMDSGQYQQTNIWDVDAPPKAPFGPRPISG